MSGSCPGFHQKRFKNGEIGEILIYLKLVSAPNSHKIYEGLLSTWVEPTWESSTCEGILCRYFFI